MMKWRPDGHMVGYGRAWVLCMLDLSVSIKDRSGGGPLIKFEQYQVHASDMGTSKPT